MKIDKCCYFGCEAYGQYRVISKEDARFTDACDKHLETAIELLGGENGKDGVVIEKAEK